MRFSTLFASSLLLLKLTSALPVSQENDDDEYEYETVTMYVTSTISAVPTKIVTVLDTTTVIEEVTVTPSATFTPIIA